MRKLFVYNGYKRNILFFILTFFITSCSTKPIETSVLTWETCGEVVENYEALKYVANNYIKYKSIEDSWYNIDVKFYVGNQVYGKVNVNVYYSFTPCNYSLENLEVNELAVQGVCYKYTDTIYEDKTYNFSTIKFYKFGNEFYAKFFYSNDGTNYINGENYYFLITPNNFGIFGPSNADMFNSLWFPYISYEVLNNWLFKDQYLITSLEGDDFVIECFDNVVRYPNIKDFVRTGHVTGDCEVYVNNKLYCFREFEAKKINGDEIPSFDIPLKDAKFYDQRAFWEKINWDFYENIYLLTEF